MTADNIPTFSLKKGCGHLMRRDVDEVLAFIHERRPFSRRVHLAIEFNDEFLRGCVTPIRFLGVTFRPVITGAVVIDEEDDTVSVFLSRMRDWDEIMATLVHELTHVSQYTDNKMPGYGEKDEAPRLSLLQVLSPRYWMDLVEREARDMERKWKRRDR